MTATLVLISGCGSDRGGSSAGGGKGGAVIGKGMAQLPVEPTEEPTEEPTGEPANDPYDDPSDTPTGGSGLVSPDAKMGTCGWSSDGKPYANVEISNSSSTTAYYSLLVGFVDSSEEVVTTGIESDASVAGGADKTIKVHGLKADSSKTAKKCRLSLATKSDQAG
ncbi:PT domain-containing protein [Streptomyces sp. NPDC005393]|uniref:PT domain-containing protein n=1 Tax=Streptomyces sp. NPDC005393 TaxID=3157041 RepID=UPI0033B0956F